MIKPGIFKRDDACATPVLRVLAYSGLRIISILITCSTIVMILQTPVASAAPVGCSTRPAPALLPNPSDVERKFTGERVSTDSALAVIPDNRVTVIGGEKLVPDEGDQNYFMLNWKYPPHGVGPVRYPFPKGWAVQFSVTGTSTIEFRVFARPGAAWNVSIDGSREWPVPQVLTLSDDPHVTIAVTLPDANRHSVRFLMNNLSLSSIYGESTGVLHPLPVAGPRAFFLGDSLTQGGKQSTGGELGSWIWRFADLCGIEDPWNGGLGSSGVLTDGDTSNYITRARTDVVPATPDIVFITSYFNDKKLAPDDIADGIAQAIDIIRGVPAPPTVVIIGSFDPNGVNGYPYTEIDTAIRAATANRGVPYIEPRTGLVYDGTGRVISYDGPSGPWITRANRSLYIGSDGVHQTDAGQYYMAERVYDAFRAIAR